MRRSDREIKELAEIVQMMERCEVCRLAFHDGEYPYIVPLNYGVQCENGRVTLYFHGAAEGKKCELMKKDNHVAFEMDGAHRLVVKPEACSSTIMYESVVGRGRLESVPEEEKEQALRILMRHYCKEEFSLSKTAVSKTDVWKLTVEEVTGKAHRT